MRPYDANPPINTKLQSKVEFVMLSGVRSEAEERNEASVQILKLVPRYSLRESGTAMPYPYRAGQFMR